MKTLPALNRRIWDQSQDIELEESKRRCINSFNEIQKIINHHTNEELFRKKRYHFTGTTSLGSYFISSTSSHYDWAHKLIKRSVKSKFLS